MANGLTRLHIGIHLVKRARFTHCRVNYYNNSDTSLNLEFLSLYGGIIPNPEPTAGKTIIKYSICGRAVAKNQLAITCDSCCQLTHIKCGGITAECYKQLLFCSNYCWNCPTCRRNLSPQPPFANLEIFANLQSHFDGKPKRMHHCSFKYVTLLVKPGIRKFIALTL